MAETQFRAFHPGAVLHEGHSVMQSWIRDNSSKDILEILTEYPHLTSIYTLFTFCIKALPGAAW